MAAAKPSLAVQVAQNPLVFAAGVGVANGVLAAARNKPVSVQAATITAGVIAAGELALILDVPKYDKPKMAALFGYSVVGTFVGLAPFISWKPGEKSWLQRAGEALANKASATT